MFVRKLLRKLYTFTLSVLFLILTIIFYSFFYSVFGHSSLQAEVLSSVTKSDVCEFFEKFLFSGEGFRKLSVQVRHRV